MNDQLTRGNFFPVATYSGKLFTLSFPLIFFSDDHVRITYRSFSLTVIPTHSSSAFLLPLLLLQNLIHLNPMHFPKTETFQPDKQKPIETDFGKTSIKKKKRKKPKKNRPRRKKNRKQKGWEPTGEKFPKKPAEKKFSQTQKKIRLIKISGWHKLKSETKGKSHIIF